MPFLEFQPMSCRKMFQHIAAWKDHFADITSCNVVIFFYVKLSNTASPPLLLVAHCQQHRHMGLTSLFCNAQLSEKHVELIGLEVYIPVWNWFSIPILSHCLISNNQQTFLSYPNKFGVGISGHFTIWFDYDSEGDDSIIKTIIDASQCIKMFDVNTIYFSLSFKV